MGTITYQHSKINTYVRPEILKSSSDVYNALTITNSIVCPDDFVYKQYINNLHNNLNDLRKQIQQINFWLLESNNKINEFESASKNFIKEINCSNKINITKTSRKKQIQNISPKKVNNDTKKTTNNFESITSQANNLFNFNVDKAMKIGNAVLASADSIIENGKVSIKKGTEEVKKTGSKIADGVKSVFNWGVEKAKQVGSKVANGVKSAINFGKVAAKTGVNNVKKTGSTVVEGAKSAFDWGIDKLKDFGGAVADKFNSLTDFIKGLVDDFINAVESIAATVLTAIQSVLKGILQFVEAIVDFAAIVGSAVVSVGTGIADGVSYIATGKTLGATSSVWEWTKGFVSYDVVNGIADIVYNDTSYGKWLTSKSLISPDGVVSNVLSGVGYVSGVVALTIATFGTGGAAVGATSSAASAGTASVSSAGMAAVAGAAGVGKGTSDAWNDGASTAEGLGYGAFNGLLEGVQFYVGGKINTFNVTKGTTAARKLANSTVRVVLDGADSAVEVPIYARLKSIYNGKSFQENWEKDGGWKAVGSAAAVGSVASSISEANLSKKALSLLNKTFKSTKGVIKNISPSSLTKLASGKFSIVKTAVAVPFSVVSQFSRFGTSKLDKPMIEKISKEGLYHITTAENVNKIFDSNTIKKSKGFLKNYGFKGKTFFFGGTPTFEGGFMNLSKVSPKFTAIKIVPNADELSSKNFRYRKYNDKAVTFAGNYDLTDTNAKQAYLVLEEEGNKLKYKEVSKMEYDNYKPNFKNEYNKKVISKPWIAYANAFQYHLDFFESGIKEVKNLRYNMPKFKNNIKAGMYKVKRTNKFANNLKGYAKGIEYQLDIFLNGIKNVKNVNLYSLPKNKNFMLVKESLSKNDGYMDIFALKKATANSIDNELNKAQIDLNLSMEKYATYSSIKESNAYKQYLKNAGYKNEVFDNLEKNMKKLDKEIEKNYEYINKLFIKKNEKNLLNLKDKIFDSMPNGLNKLEKARYIYINLSKNVKYDENYSLTSNENIYKNVLNIHNMKGNKVICKGWSELYKQLLLQSGFNENEVTIVGRPKVGSHKFVEIKFDQFKVFADATNNYNGMTDLVASKVGSKTIGFARAPLNLNLSDKGSKELREFFINRKNLDEVWLENIDKNVYKNEGNVDEISHKINETFDNSLIYSKLFGSQSNETIASKIRVLNPVLEKLDGLETYTFLRTKKSKFFNTVESNKISITLLGKVKSENEGKFITCVCVEVSDNNYKYYLNKEGTGLVEVSLNVVNNLNKNGFFRKTGSFIPGIY